jgi:hypothetical protein
MEERICYVNVMELKRATKMRRRIQQKVRKSRKPFRNLMTGRRRDCVPLLRTMLVERGYFYSKMKLKTEF